MMDNLSANKSHIPFQSWPGQNGWSTASAQGPFHNPLPSSQHLSLGSSSDQRPSYSHLQESNQSCMSDLSTLSSRSNTHPSALYKASHISSNPSSNSLFANTAIPSASHMISFTQQTPHTSSMLLTANQGKNITPSSLPQTTQHPQPCTSQHLPLFAPRDPYKAPFQPPLSNQSLPNGLLSCGQHGSTSQATFEGAYVEFAGVAGHAHSHASSTSQEQSQWIPSSHCRGPVNESVPDAAVHPKNKPSQEGKTNPPDSNERRLVILHQREQLLQQLAELDKLLESIPPEDSHDGKSPPTDTQSPPSNDDSSQCEPTMTSDAQQVQLSAENSKSQSHLSSDQQSEACDAPEDPMSAAESEKEENASSEDDSDPDYLPNSDGNLSDCMSDTERRSPEEPSHSSRPTPTDEKPSQPEKIMAKSGSSLFKDKSVALPNKICAANQKFSETVVLPYSNTVARRNYCLFCSKPVSKMSRHLENIHSDKPEVAAVFQYPKNSKERKKIWVRLIHRGNFAHNKVVLKTGKGQLAVRQSSPKLHKAHSFFPCPHCQGLFRKRNVFKHMRRCPEKVVAGNDSEKGRRNRYGSQFVLETAGDLGLSDGFRAVLSQMRYDNVTQTVMEDEVLLQFGEILFSQHGSDLKRHEYIRQNLRETARLVIEAQKMTPLKKLQDFFLPSNFPHVVTAVNVVAGYNPENKTYSTASLAVKLGYHLQKACGIVEGNAVKSGDTSLAESAQKFLSLYQENWNKLISEGALTAIKESNSNLPFAEDVKLLNIHMENVHLLAEKKLRDSRSANNYAALAKVVLARTVVFNMRSVSDVSSMQLTAFRSRQKSSLQDGMDASVTDLEKEKCEFLLRVDVQVKSGRTVPVFIKPSFLSAMELLIEFRETCGVPSRNPFLFGRPKGLTAYKGSACIQKYVKTCGAKNPEALTSIKIQKHYRKKLDDVEMDSDEETGSWDHDELSGARCGLADPHGRATKGKKGSKYKGKHKWEEAEILAVERHLMPLIEGHKVPQKNDCIQCLEAEPEALRTRSWKGVKDYVRNRITALKRQSGSSQATSSNRNRPGQV